MKNKVFTKYRRGDVWYIKLQNENGDNVEGSSVQRKSRPYVIVSCEENNNNAPVFQVIPIATMDYDHLPPHVYYNNGGRNQIVMCEQITTISVLDFQREGSRFLYSFNLEFMNKIDEALAGQLGLRVRVADMKVLENLIDKISKDKEDELKRKYESNLEMRVEQIAAKLSKKFGIPLSSEDLVTGRSYNNSDLEFAPESVKSEIKKNADDRVSTIPSNNTKEVKIIPENNSNKTQLLQDKTKFISTNVPENKSSNKSVNKWTREKMIQFLKDKEEMSLSDLSEKYNIKKKSVYQFTYLFRNRLNEKG